MKRARPYGRIHERIDMKTIGSTLAIITLLLGCMACSRADDPAVPFELEAPQGKISARKNHANCETAFFFTSELFGGGGFSRSERKLPEIFLFIPAPGCYTGSFES